MAITQAHLAANFNKDNFDILNHYIYVIAGDGDLMEGISHEAASLAGHLSLGRIILFYDDNNITIDGSTSLSCSDNAALRFQAYGWQVLNIDDVNNLAAIDSAVKSAKNDPRPTIIITKTHIGFGSPNKQDKSSSHGSPLGPDEVLLTKKKLGWKEEETFYIPDEVKEFFSKFKTQGKGLQDEWQKKFSEYSAKYPEEARTLLGIFNGQYGEEWKEKLPVFKEEGKKISTRSASGKVLNALSPALPALIGGSADLAPSNNTYINSSSDFSKENFAGKNFHFGIREHAMASIMNGMSMYAGVIPYGGTFLVFSDYLRPAIRIAALSGVRPVYVLTHDSIGLGEDGPTHQPVEHFAALRTIPGCVVIRPADANETACAWQTAIGINDHPIALILSRQNLPVLDQEKYPKASGLRRGAYILKEPETTPDVIIMASGSEVHIALEASELLAKENIKARVISFPSWELFEKQSVEYKNSLLPKQIKARISVEAGISMGWEKYLGDCGQAVSIECFGASAPAEVLMKEYGITAENVAAKAKAVLSKL
jgi:transketolase